MINVSLCFCALKQIKGWKNVKVKGVNSDLKLSHDDMSWFAQWISQFVPSCSTDSTSNSEFDFLNFYFPMLTTNEKFQDNFSYSLNTL